MVLLILSMTNVPQKSDRFVGLDIRSLTKLHRHSTVPAPIPTEDLVYNTYYLFEWEYLYNSIHPGFTQH